MCATTKWVSWTCQLNGTGASITPVSPPQTKITRKPKIHNIGKLKRTRPFHRVANQANSWIAVGTATNMLATEKKAWANCGMPTVNMWCTHRPKLIKPIKMMDSTIQRYPINGRPANTGISVETIPAAGKNRMYTSGWPNIQNRCCHRSGSPPPSIEKNTMPAARSSSSSMLANTSGGKPNTIINAMARMYQQKIGILLNDIPLVRVRRMETTSSIPAEMAEISTKVMPSNQKSGPCPGEYWASLSGVYMNQPPSGAIPNTRLKMMISPPNR